MLWVALHFPPLPARALANVAAWACQFTPKVSLEPPQALLAEVEGSLRYFGGVAGLTARLREGLAALGMEASLAVDAVPRAALWRARGGAGRLDSLPLAVTGFDTAFFKSIGVSTVGELLRLPREGLARRCGQRVLDDLDRALGTAAEAREFFVPPPRFGAVLELPAPVAHAEGLLFAARRLLVQLEGLLAARHEGTRSFTLGLSDSRDEDFAVVEVRLASASRDAARFCEMLRERLAVLALSRPAEALRIEAADFVPLQGRSGALFGDAAGDSEDWKRLLERLRARLGHDAVYGVTTHPDHRPEYAWRRIEPGDWDAHEPRIPGARPLWLTEPRRLGEDGFQLLAGPERIESGWWDGDDARRDYFVAQLHDSSMAWIYREADEWFLHGLFA